MDFPRGHVGVHSLTVRNAKGAETTKSRFVFLRRGLELIRMFLVHEMPSQILPFNHILIAPLNRAIFCEVSHHIIPGEGNAVFGIDALVLVRGSR